MAGGGGGRGGVMNWEIGIDMYTLICIKRMTNKNLLYKKLIKLKKKKRIVRFRDVSCKMKPLSWDSRAAT